MGVRKTRICMINFDLLNYNKTAAEKSTAVRIKRIYTGYFT
jgi:hypothetical protein